TTDRTVGGNPTTGTGWDMSHKAIAIDSRNAVRGLVIDGCMVDGWRGEAIYAGGNEPSQVIIRNSTNAEVNASAVATGADTLIENSVIRNALNGTENYCVAPGQKLTIKNTKFETTRPGLGINAVVYEGTKGVGATATIQNSSFSGYDKGIY